jgi:hypothetical protein
VASFRLYVALGVAVGHSLKVQIFINLIWRNSNPTSKSSAIAHFWTAKSLTM